MKFAKTSATSAAALWNMLESTENLMSFILTIQFWVFRWPWDQILPASLFNACYGSILPLFFLSDRGQAIRIWGSASTPLQVGRELLLQRNDSILETWDPILFCYSIYFLQCKEESSWEEELHDDNNSTKFLEVLENHIFVWAVTSGSREGTAQQKER